MTPTIDVPIPPHEGCAEESLTLEIHFESGFYRGGWTVSNEIPTKCKCGYEFTLDEIGKLEDESAMIAGTYDPEPDPGDYYNDDREWEGYDE